LFYSGNYSQQKKEPLIAWASHRNVKKEKKILISLVGIAIWLTAQSIHK